MTSFGKQFTITLEMLTAVAFDQRWPDVVAGISARFSKFAFALFCSVGGAVAPWLVRSTLERAIRARSLAGDIVLCSWARHFTLTVPLSTQVYKCMVPANCWGNLTKLRGSDLRWTSIPSRGSRNTSSRFVSGNIEIRGKQNSLFHKGPVINC